MRSFPIVVQQAGPLPVRVPFNSPVDGPAVLVVTGTAYSTSTGVLMQLNVLVDTKQVAIAQMYSNAPLTHRTFPTQFVDVQLTSGPHSLQLISSGTGVTSDGNDFFAAMLLY